MPSWMLASNTGRASVLKHSLPFMGGKHTRNRPPSTRREQADAVLLPNLRTPTRQDPGSASRLPWTTCECADLLPGAMEFIIWVFGAASQALLASGSAAASGDEVEGAIGLWIQLIGQRPCSPNYVRGVRTGGRRRLSLQPVQAGTGAGKALPGPACVHRGFVRQAKQ
jgi:hypothetical protein